MPALSSCIDFFFFNDTATTEIYTLSLHDALPIFPQNHRPQEVAFQDRGRQVRRPRSEEHTSELQSRLHLVCRLLLEKKNQLFISSYVLRPYLQELFSLLQHEVIDTAVIQLNHRSM